jgi:hypothetical protein
VPQDLVGRLDPARVADYAGGTGWLHQAGLGGGLVEVYQRPESDLEQVSIPVRRDRPSFARSMTDALVYIDEWEKRPALDLLHELLLPPADLIAIRESGPAVGSIDVPLDDGLKLLAGARRMLLAAACSARRPEAVHLPSRLANAESFVRRCRLVQLRNQFVITIACQLGAIPEANGPAGVPFARQVTTMLMRSLQRLALALDAQNPDLALPAPDEQVISANLCEALLAMAPEGNGSGLTISATWARTLPPVGASGNRSYASIALIFSAITKPSATRSRSTAIGTGAEKA